MIISRLTGGLGNQMFQYAAGLALADRRRTVLKLDINWYRNHDDHVSHDRYSLDCFNVGAHFATFAESEFRRNPSMFAKAVGRLTTTRERRTPGGRHAAASFTPYPEFFNLPDDTYLEGNWQSDGFFAGVEPMLRRQFTFRYPLTDSAAALADELTREPHSVAVHIRRGDYATSALNPHCRPLASGYYDDAVGLIKGRLTSPKFYIFSDDIRTVSREFCPDVEHVYVKPDPDWQPFDEMNLMSACQHFIIANSTFSWWAAWLARNPTKIVLAPDPWFANTTYDGSKVVPAQWTRIRTRHVDR